MSRARANPRRRSRRGRGRNPWSHGQKIAAVLGVLGVSAAAIGWHRYSLRKALEKPGSETINYNYVPHIGTWPHQDRYPSEHAFGLQLQEWGYDPGPINTNEQWTIIDAAPIDAVREFQQDFNRVRRISLPEGSPPSPPELVEDGLIGNNTALAFWTAEQWASAMGLMWKQLVELAWGETEDS